MQAAFFAGDVGTIVVYKLDRLSRNLRNGIHILGGRMLPHEAAESVLDAFRRAVAGELELSTVRVVEG